MGFSPIGLVVGLAVLAPNLLLLRFPPRTQLPSPSTPRLLGRLERVGQGLCLVVPVVTEPGPARWGWAAPALVCLVAYHAAWVRYLVEGRDVRALYRPWHGVPVPMAVLPVMVFLATAVWLSNPWIALAALVLAAGHVPVAVGVARTLGVTR